MNDLAEAVRALDREIVRVAIPGFFRMPNAKGYVTIEANRSGILDFAQTLIEIAQEWTPGKHHHFEHLDLDSNPPLVLMMGADE